jgi:MYND finger
VRYCSKECQAVAWPLHKANCESMEKERTQLLNANALTEREVKDVNNWIEKMSPAFAKMSAFKLYAFNPEKSLV